VGHEQTLDRLSEVDILYSFVTFGTHVGPNIPVRFDLTAVWNMVKTQNP